MAISRIVIVGWKGLPLFYVGIIQNLTNPNCWGVTSGSFWRWGSVGQEEKSFHISPLFCTSYLGLDWFGKRCVVCCKPLLNDLILVQEIPYIHNVWTTSESSEHRCWALGVSICGKYSWSSILKAASLARIDQTAFKVYLKPRLLLQGSFS